MSCMNTIDNVRPSAAEISTDVASARTWTLAAAKSDVERGLLDSLSIHVHGEEGKFFYTVSVLSTLEKDGTGPLVDARTEHIRKFKTMDAAHSAIRQAGFRCNRFWANAK